MSDPFLPVPPESEDGGAEEELEDLEDDEQPDVLAGVADDEPAGSGAAERDAGAFHAPRPGDRLTASELESELD